jgi:serine/threonine protein kinase
MRSQGVMYATDIIINEKGLVKIVQEKGTPLDLVDERIIRKEKKKIINQVKEGLKFLHSHLILHGDIKPQNILMITRREPCFKVNDFSFSMLMSSDPQKIEHRIYSPGWRPPEINDGLVSLRSDVWAYGKLLHILFGIRGNEMKYDYRERPFFWETQKFVSDKKLIEINSSLPFKTSRHQKIFCQKIRNRGNHISCSREYLEFERDLCNNRKFKIKIEK